jgi:hypothetical protein
MGLVSRLVVGPQDKKKWSQMREKKKSKEWIDLRKKWNHLEEERNGVLFWTWGSTTSPKYGFTK